MTSHLKSVIYLCDDARDTDRFRVPRTVRADGTCMTQSVGMLQADSPTRLVKYAALVVDGPVCAQAFIKYLIVP
jgi:hypothetical protein